MSKRSLQPPQEASNEFLFLVKAIPQLIWTAQPDGQIDYVNPRWYIYTNTTTTHIPGEKWRYCYHPEDQQRILDLWHTALRNGTFFDILPMAEGQGIPPLTSGVCSFAEACQIGLSPSLV